MKLSQDQIFKATSAPIESLYKEKTCPFCNTENFKMSNRHNVFHCFNCKESGGVVQLAMHLTGKEYKDTIIDLLLPKL